jgi:hypothetical protein
MRRIRTFVLEHAVLDPNRSARLAGLLVALAPLQREQRPDLVVAHVAVTAAGLFLDVEHDCRKPPPRQPPRWA